MKWVFGGFLCIFMIVGSEILFRCARNRNMEMLYDAGYRQKNKEIFERVIQSTGCRLTIPLVNRFLIAVNFYISINDQDKVIEAIEKAGKIPLRGDHAISFYRSVFGFLAQHEEKERCRQLLAEMDQKFHQFKNPSAVMLLYDSHLVYDVYIKHDLSRIPDLQQCVKAAPDNESKSVYEFRLAKLYFDADDLDHCRELLLSAWQHTHSDAAKQKISLILEGRYDLL